MSVRNTGFEVLVRRKVRHFMRKVPAPELTGSTAILWCGSRTQCETRDSASRGTWAVFLRRAVTNHSGNVARSNVCFKEPKLALLYYWSVSYALESLSPASSTFVTHRGWNECFTVNTVAKWTSLSGLTQLSQKPQEEGLMDPCTDWPSSA
jgi:hypothetical protein